MNQVIGDFVKSYGLFNGDEVSLKPPVNLNPSMKLRFHKELKSRSSAMLDQAEILKKKMVGE